MARSSEDSAIGSVAVGIRGSFGFVYNKKYWRTLCYGGVCDGAWGQVSNI